MCHTDKLTFHWLDVRFHRHEKRSEMKLNPIQIFRSHSIIQMGSLYSCRLQQTNFSEDMNAGLITVWCNNPQHLRTAVTAAKDVEAGSSLLQIEMSRFNTQCSSGCLIMPSVSKSYWDVSNVQWRKAGQPEMTETSHFGKKTKTKIVYNKQRN